MNWLDTPTGVALVSCAAVIFGAVFGFWIGYEIGRHPAPPTQIIFQPGAIQVQPGPAK